MTEGLREIPTCLCWSGEILLGEETKVVAKAGEFLEETRCILGSSYQVIGARQPERARQEYPFFSRETVLGFARVVA